MSDQQFLQSRSRRSLATPGGVVLALTTAVGFVYVTVLLCGRDNPLKTAHGDGWDFPVAVILAAIVGFVADAFRKQQRTFDKDSGALPESLLFFAGVIPALHWQVFVKLSGVDWTLTPGGVKATPGVIAGLAVAAGLLAGMVAVHLLQARRAGFLATYAILAALPQTLIATVTAVMWGTHRLHYHHYLLGATLLPFACFRGPVSRISQGFLLGLFIEGAARWGFDPVWIAR